jgi:hypothetical protein
MILDSFLALCAWFTVDLGYTEPSNKIINAIKQQPSDYAPLFNWMDLYNPIGFMQYDNRKDQRYPKFRVDSHLCGGKF